MFKNELISGIYIETNMEPYMPDIDDMLNNMRYQPNMVQAALDENKQPTSKQTLILALSIITTGPNVLKDQVISVGLYAGLSTGETMIQQKWRFRLINTKHTNVTIVNDETMAAAQDVDAMEQYFNKTMWAYRWKDNKEILRILQTETVEAREGWSQVAMIMDSFHIEYPPSKYDVKILCPSHDTVPFIDTNIYNTERHDGIWETFNPILRDVSIVDMSSAVEFISDEKKNTVASCVNAITLDSGLPEHEAERMFNAYLMLNA